MVRYALLGSGSSANAYIFEHGESSVLVDNGFSCRELLRRAEKGGFDPSQIRWILLTHVHGDHLKGVEVLSRRLGVPVVHHKDLNLEDFVKGPLHDQILLTPGENRRLGPLTVFPFETSHDVPYSLGYTLELGGRRFCLITDTGVISQEMASCAAHSDVLFLEANYCSKMLKEGPYPPALKRRIVSNRGHLSNEKAVAFLNNLGKSPKKRLRLVYLCHLSGTNNDPKVVQAHLDEHLTWPGEVKICPKGAMLPTSRI